jgi:hypothetical protein
MRLPVIPYKKRIATRRCPPRDFWIADLLFLLLGSMVLSGCGEKGVPQASQTVYPCTYNNMDSLPYIDSITCPDEFQALKGNMLQQTFSQVASVKVVYEISTQRIYYISSKQFQIHFNFCQAILQYSNTHYNFNLEQYGNTNQRQYYLGAINHYTSSDLYTLEVYGGDQISSDGIKTLFDKACQTTFFGEDIRFMPTSTALVDRIADVASELRTIKQDEVFGGQIYQALNQAHSYGYLRKIDLADLVSTSIGRHDIIVVNGIPNDIPVISGIITTEFQTPLSHINVLSYNRGTPNMAWKDCWNEPLITSNLNKLVYFSVQLDTFILRDATFAEADSFWQAVEPSQPVSLECNDSTPGLCNMSDLSHASIPLVGAKASNFAELVQLFPGDSVCVPEGAFAIPFYYYSTYIKSIGADTLLDQLIADPLAKTDYTRKNLLLGNLRNRILHSQLDPAFISSIDSKIRSSTTYSKIRFRSSTNAEDLQGFNGAGLYESYSADLTDPQKSIEKAIKQVYASLWTLAGFEEREYFKIDHKSIAMGILVHRSFPDEKANGVAITRNIYNPDMSAYTINVQVDEISVVNPPQGYTADQFLYYITPDVYTNPAIEYISHSNATSGAPVLNQHEIVLLYRSLEKIHDHFYFKVFRNSGIPNQYFAMDVEFKIDKNERKLYIKQARPY